MLLCCALASAVVGAVDLQPNRTLEVVVPIGSDSQAFHFHCNRRPANVLVELKVHTLDADPLLLLSTNPRLTPSVETNDGTSLDQWRETAADKHYVLAREVGPDGGIVVVTNLRRFSTQRLNGELTLVCSYIAAFDLLFFNHVTESPLCPVGDGSIGKGQWCSGNGRCRDDLSCKCRSDFTGDACESKKEDMLLVDDARFSVDLPAGKYKYFRVRIPEEFAGGYLSVQVNSSGPVVVLGRVGGLPTKARFDNSNFDDWISRKNNSNFVIPICGTEGGCSDVVSADDDSQEQVPADQWQRSSRRVQECSQAEVHSCEKSCVSCMLCVPSATNSCDTCDTCEFCLPKLEQCRPVQCDSPEAESCRKRCGKCAVCVDSNDAFCAMCGQCKDCVAWLTQCEAAREDSEAKYVFVGLLNHDRYYDDQMTAIAHLQLVESPELVGARERVGLLGEMYNAFQTVQQLVHENPAAGQHRALYEIGVNARDVTQNIRVLKDRVTLLKVRNSAVHAQTSLALSCLVSSDTCLGPADIRAVLSSTKASPKTLFDFDRLFVGNSGRNILLRTADAPVVWFAIFAKKSAQLQVTVHGHGAHQLPETEPSSSTAGDMAQRAWGFITMWGGLAVGGYLLYQCGVRYVERRSRRGTGRFGRQEDGESAAMLDHQLEQQHMFRGGYGDDEL